MHTITETPCISPRITAADTFESRFGCPLPLGLRTESAGLSWTEFVDRYSPSGVNPELALWPNSPRGTGENAPIAALTAMLYDAGSAVEILSFHQRPVAEGTATFVRCEHEGRRHWAVAISDSGTDSAVRAVLTAASILSGAR